MLSFLALMSIGVIMVYSASVDTAYQNDGSQYFVIQREILWTVLGCIGLALMTRIDYRRWQQFSLPIFVGTFLLLALVLVPHLGHMANGARRWFYLGAGVDVQPSEMMKLAGVIYFAAWFASKGDRVRDFQSTFVPFSLMAGVIALLIEKEPDLGTTIVVVCTFFAIFYVAGANLRHLATLMGGAGIIAWVLAHRSSYQLNRFMAFTDPWKDASGTGYHTVHALLALGSGGLFGVGLGNSVQKHVLPAPHTDSILAVIGEEWGLLGTVVVLLLFLIIAYRGMRTAVAAPDTFGRLLAAGITSWITIQALLNFAVITSSVPFTGVPLPFISYGGTSLVITIAALGILLNISRNTTGEGFARGSTHHGRGDRRPRLPGADDTPGSSPAPPGRKPAVRVTPPRSAGRPRSRATS
jgi:cell division protein FtsW